MNIKQRISSLRKLMKEKKIDIYYIPNEDDHLSAEYTADHFKCKQFMSGFTGESGCMIVTQKFAGLWTDGRFFTQAEQELKGSGIKLMRMAQEGVPNPIPFLIAETPKNGVVGYDGNVVSASLTLQLQQSLKHKNAKLHINDDLVGKVWGDERPHMPEGMLYTLAKKYTGEDVQTRLKRVRDVMAKKGADVLILTALEDPCWVFNVRGDDIACTPVAYAFAIIQKNAATYYVDQNKLTTSVKKHFKDNKVQVKSYDALKEDITKFKNQKILVSLAELNTVLYASLQQSNTIINEDSPIELFRACKNQTEIKNIRNAHVKDGVAMVKFLHYVKTHVGKEKMSEVSAQNVLYALREAQQDYIEPSFPTISAYQENAAMMHYNATDESYADIKPRGFLLVDSGGTYKDGTTDITRTIALGKLTKEEKKLYTLVLKGHLQLARAKFLQGSTGNNLDILARQPLWEIGIDYQCGTGHGVGHVLSVHEGPQGIRWGFSTQRKVVPLLPGMVVTDEPGVYMPYKLGIRIENELIVTKDVKNEYGQFLNFETVTYCPYELDAIDTKYLEQADIDQINAYHKMVYEKVFAYLTNEEKAWLKKATRMIKK